MVSRTALTCNHYAAGCTKTSTKILHQKNSKKEENAPDSARKRRNRVRFGCWRGVQPVRTGGETRNPNQNAPDSNATHEKRKPAKTQCFRRFFGRGRRTWSPLRSGRLVACVPPARTRPSARGFGVDVETAHKEQERGSVARFLLQDENVRCWFGAFRFSRSKTRIESPLEISLRMSSLKSYICMYTEE